MSLSSSLSFTPSHRTRITHPNLRTHVFTNHDYNLKTEIASITLHFWYQFVSCLEETEPYEYRQVQVDRFGPQLMRLVDSCVTGLLRPPDDVDDLPPDEVDGLQRSREHACETLDDCCRLLGSDAVVSRLDVALRSEVEKASGAAQQQQQHCGGDGGSPTWHGVEACLLAFGAVHRYVSSDEDRTLPFLMGSVIPALPTVPRLRDAAHRCVGGYAPWLDRRPDALGPLLPLLAAGLGEASCAETTASAIRELCECCGSASGMADGVLGLHEGIVTSSVAANNGSMVGESREGAVVGHKVALVVLEGACKAVSRTLEVTGNSGSETTATAEAYVTRIVGPIVTMLTTALNGSSVKAASAELDRLTVVVRFLQVPRTGGNVEGGGVKIPARAKFLLDLLSHSWPLLDTLGTRFPRDVSLAEKLCRFHKHTLRGCGSHAYLPMVTPLRSQIVRNYKESRLSPYLYLASVCISEYGRDRSHAAPLMEMLTELCNVTFSFLRTEEEFVAHPDIVEELFFLAGRMMTMCPLPLVLSPLLAPLIRAAVVGMRMQHRDANRGTLNYLENVVSYGLTLPGVGGGDGIVVDGGVVINALNVPGVTSSLSSTPAAGRALEEAILREGGAVISNLILALVGDFPCYRIDAGYGSVAGILHKLSRLCPSELFRWVDGAMVRAPEPAKSIFRGELLRNPILPREEFFRCAKEFAFECDRDRRMRGF